MVLPTGIQVIVASFGGVGTTFLLEHISRFRKTNHPNDADGLKHLPMPPISLHRQVRYVYVYGDPIVAVVSLFRRGFQHAASMKFGRFQDSATEPVPDNMSLADYAAQRIDRLNLIQHFDNWYSKYTMTPTLFVRYETLFENIDTLANFLELPKLATDTFPRKKPRKSSLDQLSSQCKTDLGLIYGEFSERLNGLDDVVLRQRTRSKTYASVCLSKPYRRSFAAQILRSPRGLVKHTASRLRTR